MQRAPPGLTEDQWQAILRQARSDVLARTAEARAALDLLHRGGEKKHGEPLLRFFHSIAGVFPSLGFRELGYLAKLSEDMIRLFPAQPALLDLVQRNFGEVCELLLELAPEPPPAENDEAGVEAPAAGPPAAAVPERPTVLVVDDDAASVQLVEACLAPGFRVIPCTSPTQVLEILNQQKPDLTILDVMMPSVDGFELCRRIRARTQQSYMPILFLSASDALEERVRGLSVGGDDFLKKPFEPIELLARVRTHLQRVATMRELSIRDALTRTYNRGYFDERLRLEVKRRGRSGGRLALAMLDIDFFKRVNDRFGHLAGDAVLVQTAQLLSAQFRSSDVLSRYGGEEFALILLETELEAAVGSVARACARISHAPMTLSIPDGTVTVSLTLSGGVAELRPGETHQRLIARADRALYAAKESGRNRIVPADQEAP